MKANGILSVLSFCDVCSYVDQFVGRGDGLRKQQRQDSHINFAKDWRIFGDVCARGGLDCTYIQS